jgi:hypothetical protein
MRTVNLNSLWTGLGLSLFSATVGLLVGASQTPVAGVLVTAIFGVVVAAIGFFDSRNVATKLDSLKSEMSRLSISGERVDEEKISSVLGKSLAPDSARVGKLLFLFSAFFLLGIVGGALLRVNAWPSPKRVVTRFPWSAQTAPTMPYNALDWIAIQDSLLKMGYSEEQVQQLYRLQYSVWQKSGENIPSSGLVTKSEPLSGLLKGQAEPVPEQSKGLVVYDDSAAMGRTEG